MKTQTRNQLFGVILGTAIAVGINLLPGLSGQAKMWGILVAVLAILAIFSLPSVKRMFTQKTNGDHPESGSVESSKR